jgi:ssDNA-binding Zn-finger/Zn-ribbon topoisomerase 1
MEEVSITIACPDCGRPLVVRTNRDSGSEFLGCTGYAVRDREDRPACSHTEPLPAYVHMLRAGAELLPGF